MTKNNLQTYPLDRILVSPSVLSADYAALGTELERIEKAGADLVHLDVMDGHFVPNLTIGPALIASIRKHTKLLFDAHLMISHPKVYAKAFADAGSDHITFHIESEDDPMETIRVIHELGCTAGVSLKPGTPASALKAVLPHVEMILLMTVEPGFGGQSFQENQIPKALEIKKMIEESGRRIHFEADGGITEKNAPELARAGINVLVAGTAVFRHPEGPETAIARLHDAARFLPSRHA